MPDKSIESMELIKTLLTIIISTIASFTTFIFYVKGKKKEVQLNKLTEINIVLSHLLTVWYNFKILSVFCNIDIYKKTNLPFSQKKHVLLQVKFSGLKDKNFTELEESIKNLRKYDPILFFTLEDIGNKLNHMLNHVIVILIKNSPELNFPADILSKYLKEITEGLEQLITETTDHLDKPSKKKIINKLKISFTLDSDQMRENFLTSFYKAISLFDPTLSYDVFINDLKSPEGLKAFDKIMDLVILVDNPNDVLDFIKEHGEANLSIDDLHAHFTESKS